MHAILVDFLYQFGHQRISILISGRKTWKEKWCEHRTLCSCVLYQWIGWIYNSFIIVFWACCLQAVKVFALKFGVCYKFDIKCGKLIFRKIYLYASYWYIRTDLSKAGSFWNSIYAHNHFLYLSHTANQFHLISQGPYFIYLQMLSIYLPRVAHLARIYTQNCSGIETTIPLVGRISYISNQVVINST